MKIYSMIVCKETTEEINTFYLSLSKRKILRLWSDLIGSSISNTMFRQKMSLINVYFDERWGRKWLVIKMSHLTTIFTFQLIGKKRLMFSFSITEANLMHIKFNDWSILTYFGLVSKRNQWSTSKPRQASTTMLYVFVYA